MPYFTSCDFCSKTFKTGRTLSNHLASLHPQLRQRNITFSDEKGKLFEAPEPREIPKEIHADYLKWLSVLLERVNGSLLPNYPGKWSCIDCFQAPTVYFSHMLYRLKSPLLNSVRDVGHRRQPMFAKETKRVSFKIYEEQLFREVFEEQDFVTFKAKALYQNDKEVPDISDMDVEDALALAKERAKKNVQKAGRPTSSSTTEISRGEGRCTREVEFIWWPTLYSQDSRHGKLSVRFYLKKVSI